MLMEIKKKYEHYFLDKKNRYQGEYKDWYRNGQLRTHCFYKDTAWHGEYKAWFYNGQLREQCSYVNDELHGEYKRYSESGQLEQHCFFVDDKKHGESKWIYKNEIIEHCFYINGREVSFDEIPYPVTLEDRMYFVLKYNIKLLPVVQVC